MINCTHKLNESELVLSFKKLEDYENKFIEFDLILDKKYQISINQESAKKLFSKMSEIDGTLELFFKKQGYYDWKINLPLNSSNTRFSELLPFFFRDISLDLVLKDYQKTGSSWLQDGNEKILADDMGLGKSLQTINALLEKFYKLEIKNFIIACPSTLIENWKREFIKWAPHLNVYYIKANQLNDKDEFFKKIKKSNGVVINYEQLSNFNNLFDLKNANFDIAIADEAHRLRKTNSNNHKNFSKIKSKSTWLITGTPFERNREDIEGILKILNPANASVYNSKATDFILKVGLEERMLRRLKKDVLGELPPVTKKIEILEMLDDQKKEYNQCIRDSSKARSDKKIGYIPKLLNISTMSRNGSSAKINRAMEIIHTSIEEKRKVVVFSYFNQPLENFHQILKKNKIKSELFIGTIENSKRSEIIEIFQSTSKIDVLLCNGKIAGEGITLTKASIVIFINEAWNPSSNRQAEDRINRIGQEQNINIYYLRCAGTIDEDLDSILKIKGKDELEFLEVV